jgi:hypothetical protein
MINWIKCYRPFVTGGRIGPLGKYVKTVCKKANRINILYYREKHGRTSKHIV